MDIVPQYPLYGSTYNAYRITPLHHGPSRLLIDEVLQSHARRLRNVLKGDVVRGVQIGLAPTDSTIANLGPLENCTWDLIGDEASWAETRAVDVDDEMSDDLAPAGKRISPDVARGIHIQIQYPKTTHTALLLRNPTNSDSPESFTPLPLLLLRMPQPIREIVIDYLTTTFDTRISPLRLRPGFLSSSFESLFAHITDHEPPESIPDVVKTLQIQLAFPTITDQLKHIDISIARDDLHDFVRRGQHLDPESDAPFTGAIILYLSSHLALEPHYIRSGISKATCALFALSTNGKLKLTAPSPSLSDASDEYNPLPPSAPQLFMQDFYTSLVAEATPTPDFRTPAPPAATRKGNIGKTPRRTKRAATAEREGGARKKQERAEDDELADADDAHTVRSAGTPARLSVPADPPPPYELHDPAQSQRASAQPGAA